LAPAADFRPPGFLPDEGSAKPLGGTHLLLVAGYSALYGQAGIFYIFVPDC
jgi:hypothetical protein